VYVLYQPLTYYAVSVAGLNKISHLYTVAAQGTKFKVLPSLFAVAPEHDKSPSWQRTFGGAAGPIQRVRINTLYKNFKRDVDLRAAALHAADAALRELPLRMPQATARHRTVSAVHSYIGQMQLPVQPWAGCRGKTMTAPMLHAVLPMATAPQLLLQRSGRA
jgi:hypothetical protein